MDQDVDEFGIPKKAAPAKVDEFGIPIKKKVSTEPSSTGGIISPDHLGKIPTGSDFTPIQNNYSEVTDPALRHRLKENDAHYAAIKMAKTMQDAKGMREPVLSPHTLLAPETAKVDDPNWNPDQKSLTEQINQAFYLPALNEGFNNLVTKPYVGTADFFNRTMDKAYHSITGENAPDWLVGDHKGNKTDILHQIVKGYDDAYQQRDKPSNVASDVLEGTIGSIPLMAALFTGEGETSIATKLPNLFSKTAKVFGTTGALDAYADATKEGKTYEESAKEAIKGGAEGVKQGLELDASMLIGGALGKGVANKLAEAGLLKGGKAAESLLHALAVGTTFAGTSAGNDLLEGKDINVPEAMKQMGMGFAFEAIPVAKALHDEISTNIEGKKINNAAAQAGAVTAAASNMNAESMMRTLMMTPIERLQAINDNVQLSHDNLYAQSLDNGMKAFEATDPNEKRNYYANQLLLKTQGDVKNLANHLSDPDKKAEITDDIVGSDELTDDHKAELLKKLDILTPEAKAEEPETKPAKIDESKEQIPEPPKTPEEAGAKPEEPVTEKIEPIKEEAKPIKEEAESPDKEKPVQKAPEKEVKKKPVKQEAESPDKEKPVEKASGDKKIKVKDNTLIQPSKLKGSKYNLALAELPDGKFGIVDTNSGYTISDAYDDEGSARNAYAKSREKLTPKMIDDAIAKIERQPKAAGMVMSLPFMNELVEHDVKPFVQKVATNFKEALGAIVRTISPKTGVSLQAKDIITKNLNVRNESMANVDKAVGAIEKMFDKMPDEDRIAFIDRLKRGQPQATPELQAIADMYGKMDKELYDEVNKFKESLPFKENHFRVLWKELPGGEKSRSWFGSSKRPLEGSKGFLKKATLADISEGIARGGVPLSTNPMTMFKAAYADAMKFVTAHRMFDALNEDGFIKFVRNGGEVPEGYTKIDDKIASVYFPVKEGVVKTGEFYIEKNAGRLVNNHLSRDLIRESPVGRGLMNLKNIYTAAELGLSGYHASAIALEGISSDIGRGMRKLVNLGLRGDFKSAGEGILDILKSPFSPKTTFSLGRNTIKLATEGEFEKSDFGKKFLKANPLAKQYIHDLFMGGGLMKQSADLKANTYKAMKEAAGKDNYIGAALRSIPALNELVMSPLFDHYIPAMKVGMFMKEFPLALQEQQADLASGKTTRAEIARKTVDFIDDRLGEMNFDNLFWNRTFKTSMQLMLRSVTWKLGNLRAMGGAPIEQAMEFYNAAKQGRAPNLSPKVAWVLGLATMQTALATVTQYIATGTYPQNIKDLIAPRLDKDDDKQRIVLPTYIKDVTHLAYKGPADYIRSSLAGDLGKLNDIWSNSDFQKYQIYNPNDGALDKAKDIGEYVLPKPISFSNLQKSIKEGDSYGQMAMSFFGLNKAPKYLTSPPIENKIFDLFNLHEGVKSKGDKDVHDLKAQIKSLYVQKKYEEAEKVASDAMEKGLITQKQFGYLNKHLGSGGSEDPSMFFYGKLPMDDKIALWKEMTPKEREIYDPKGTVQMRVLEQQLYEEKHQKKDKPYSSFDK